MDHANHNAHAFSHDLFVFLLGLDWREGSGDRARSDAVKWDAALHRCIGARVFMIFPRKTHAIAVLTAEHNCSVPPTSAEICSHNTRTGEHNTLCKR